MTMTQDPTALARQALLEVTAASTIGAVVDTVDEGDGVVSVRFANTMPGYPGWRWTVSVAQVEGDEPTVLEVELMPGDGSLVAPDWVPWSDRLADYRASQDGEDGEDSDEHEPDDDSDDDDDESDDDDDDESDDDDDDESDDDDDDESDDDDDDDDDLDGDLGDDAFDGVDVEEAAAAAGEGAGPADGEADDDAEHDDADARLAVDAASEAD